MLKNAILDGCSTGNGAISGWVDWVLGISGWGELKISFYLREMILKTMPCNDVSKLEGHLFRLYDKNSDDHIDFVEFMNIFKVCNLIQCTMAQALNKFGIKDFDKMIPSAPIFPLSLSNSLSFA